MDYPLKKHIKVGGLVEVRKEGSGDDIVRGYVKEVLSKDQPAKGVKVVLTSSITGRVVHLVTVDELRRENFIYYNKFFHARSHYVAVKKNNKELLILDTSSGKTGYVFSDSDAAKKFKEKATAAGMEVGLKKLSSKKEWASQLAPFDIVIVNNERKTKLPVFLEFFKKVSIM